MKDVSRAGRLNGLSAGRRPRGVFLFGAAWLCLLCAFPSPPARARQRHEHEAAAQGDKERGASPRGQSGVIAIGRARLTIPDVEVLDQDGRRVRFYSDLIKDRVVVISFFFTRCTLMCPMQGRTLTKLQAGLGERLGRDVFFILVSRDPEHDSPERLRSWGAAYGVGPGWALVTGEEGPMANLLRDFTGESPGRESHDPTFLIGNDRAGVWAEAEVFSSPEALIKVIDRVSQAPAVLDR